MHPTIEPGSNTKYRYEGIKRRHVCESSNTRAHLPNQAVFCHRPAMPAGQLTGRTRRLQCLQLMKDRNLCVLLAVLRFCWSWQCCCCSCSCYCCWGPAADLRHCEASDSLCTRLLKRSRCKVALRERIAGDQLDRRGYSKTLGVHQNTQLTMHACLRFVVF